MSSNEFFAKPGIFFSVSEYLELRDLMALAKVYPSILNNELVWKYRFAKMYGKELTYIAGLSWADAFFIGAWQNKDMDTFYPYVSEDAYFHLVLSGNILMLREFPPLTQYGRLDLIKKISQEKYLLSPPAGLIHIAIIHGRYDIADFYIKRYNSLVYPNIFYPLLSKNDIKALEYIRQKFKTIPSVESVERYGHSQEVKDWFQRVNKK